MPNPNAVVSSVIRFDPPLDRAPIESLRADRGLSVELEGGRRVRLDPANPRSVGFAQILDGLSKQRRPVYLEVDPATSTITLLLIPHVTRVHAIRPIDDDSFGVQLEHSHARHVLRRSNPDFALIERQLREAFERRATIILTEDDAHNIIDVRLFIPGPDSPIPPLPEEWFPPRFPRLTRFLRWILRPKYWFSCMTLVEAQQVFNSMSATTCNPLSVAAPCIPFLYPDNGCWVRAHEMCRLMIAMGLSPRKVWIQGNLRVNTKKQSSMLRGVVLACGAHLVCA